MPGSCASRPIRPRSPGCSNWRASSTSTKISAASAARSDKTAFQKQLTELNRLKTCGMLDRPDRRVAADQDGLSQPVGPAMRTSPTTIPDVLAVIAKATRICQRRPEEGAAAPTPSLPRSSRPRSIAVPRWRPRASGWMRTRATSIGSRRSIRTTRATRSMWRRFWIVPGSPRPSRTAPASPARNASTASTNACWRRRSTCSICTTSSPSTTPRWRRKRSNGATCWPRCWSRRARRTPTWPARIP